MSSAAASKTANILEGAYHAERFEVMGLLTISDQKNKPTMSATTPPRTSNAMEIAAAMELITQRWKAL